MSRDQKQWRLCGRHRVKGFRCPIKRGGQFPLIFGPLDPSKYPISHYFSPIYHLFRFVFLNISIPKTTHNHWSVFFSLDLCLSMLRKTAQVIVMSSFSGKLHCQNIFRPHENKKAAFSNSSGRTKAPFSLQDGVF